MEVDAVVRSEDPPQSSSAGAKRVHYAGATHDIGVGGDPLSANGLDEEDRDDEAAYLRYQA